MKKPVAKAAAKAAAKDMKAGKPVMAGKPDVVIAIPAKGGKRPPPARKAPAKA
jgi:hypothetical protein